jgi:orotate phosphoribosyltransferase
MSRILDQKTVTDAQNNKSNLVEQNSKSNSNDELIKLLLHNGIMRRGDFILKSGLRSNIFFDFKGISGNPGLLYLLCKRLSEITYHGDKCVGGVPLGAVPYATIFSHITGCPMILIREEKRSHGLQKQIEGKTYQLELILIEDIITTGQSVIDTLEVLKEHNIKVAEVLCLFNREQGGKERIEKLGYKVNVLLNMTQVRNVLDNQDRERMRNAKL